MGLVFASPLLESVFYHLAVAAHTLSSDERFAVACSDARDLADADADLIVVTSPSFFNFLPPCRLADSIIASKLLLLCRLASGYSELAAGRTWTRMRMRPCLDLSRIHHRPHAQFPASILIKIVDHTHASHSLCAQWPQAKLRSTK